MKTLKMAAMAAACVAMMSSCSEDRYEDPRPAAEEGDAVQFGLDLGAQSRTMYGPDTEGATAQSIFWGNYIAGKTESIRVFCNESPAGRNIATYTVTPQAKENSIAAQIDCSSGQPIQWGGQETGYTFYAIYPADRAAEVLNGTTLTVTVNNGQSPVNYGEGGTNVNNNLVLEPNSSHDATPVTIYGNPDMSNALMYAKTETNRTSDPVGLHFNVLTDVLEVTVNGPVQSNTLALVNGNYQAADYIEIRAIDIESKSGSPLGGQFNVDLSTGDYSGNPMYPVRRLHMNTALVNSANNSVSYPKLYWRGTNGYDKLKVRFFLWPGVEASDIRVLVDTDCGQFVLENLGGTFEQKKIHKLSLPHFVSRGRDFNLSRWMEALDPNVYISELSIPGAFHAANSSYQTQAEFNDMYDAGVRAYEVQASIVDGVATVASGSDGATRTLEDVIRTVGEKMAAGAGTESAKTGFVYFMIGDPDAAHPKGFATAVGNALMACKDYIYQERIDENTTLGDVKGKIVIKINTNSDSDYANEKGWSTSIWPEGQFPALFTRWQWSYVGEAKHAAMQWGAPIDPEDQTATLQWYYNEQDAMVSGNGATSLDNAVSRLQNAVRTVSQQSLEAYKNQGAGHSVFYLMTIGGYYNTVSTAPQIAANMNPYMLSMLINPDREPSPTGIVLMNFCRGTISDPTAYSSQELIKAIVYNNNNFIMKRKPRN